MTSEAAPDYSPTPTVSSGGPAPYPEWITVEQCADILQISKVLVRKLVRQGTLPGRRFGRCLRIPRSAVVPPNFSTAV
jgi:excisionase family DNA binding protein